MRTYIRPGKIYDIHTHLNPQRLGAESLRKIIGYHFLMTEMFSLGIPVQKLDEKILDEEWMGVVIQNLPKIKNTSSFWMANKILQDLYDLDLNGLNLSNWKRFEKKIKNRYKKDTLWPWKIIKDYCHVERCLTVFDYPLNFREPDKVSIFKRSKELLDFGSRDDIGPISVMKSILRKNKICANDIKDYMKNEIDKAMGKGGIALTIWLGRYEYGNIEKGELDHLLKKNVDETKISKAIISFKLKYLFDYLNENKTKPCLQFIIGAHVDFGKYDNWPGRIFDLVNPNIFYSCQKLFDQYPQIKIDILVSNSGHAREIDTLVRMLPNVSVSGTWLHTMFPNQVRKIFSDRFEFLPLGKISAFFSDAYNAEWVYGKLALAKVCLEDVVREKIEMGWWDKDFACSIGDKIFWENPTAVYSP